MPISYRIDAEQGVIHSRFEGELTLELLKDYSTRLRRDPAFRAGLDELALVLPEHVTSLTADQMNLFTRWFKELEPIRRIAVVAESDAGFGMGRMFQQLLDESGTEVGVFRDPRAARTWLGLPEEAE